MKLAIMQPYLFPYLGYFQLIHAADAFVVYDDVNYIKGGWINRNYILSQGNKLLITLPLQGASPNRLIKQIEVSGRAEKMLKTLRQCYGKAPQFQRVFPLLENILIQPEKNLARFLDYGLRQICDYLCLHPRWHISSMLNKENRQRGPDKVMSICAELGATHYINAAGGRGLYDPEKFARMGVRLSFIQSRHISYKQLGRTFVPNLSIIDVLMFEDRDQCCRLLEEYDLV